MNITCDNCRDNDPECKECHGHPYVTCEKAACVLWMRDGYTKWRTGLEVLHEAAMKVPNLTEYASKAMPMSTHEELLKESRQRYEPGTGPWSKDDMLDQIDLVHLEALIEPVPGRIIKRLVKEVRDARSWPTPLHIEPNVTYEPPSADVIADRTVKEDS